MKIEDLIDGIHTLVSHNVIGDKQAFNRYKGFRAELLFEDYLIYKYPKYKILEGGIIISKDSSVSSLDNSVYLSIISYSEFTSDYNNLFQILSNIGFKEMFLITYDDRSWESRNVMDFKTGNISLSVPQIKVRQFDITTADFGVESDDITKITGLFSINADRNKNRFPVTSDSRKWLFSNLEGFSYKQILKIYMNRVFFDGFIGYGVQRGKPSDIDFVLKRPDGKYSLVEVKEKDLPKNHIEGFGLDVPRIKDFTVIYELTKLDYFLVVRQINNQADRKFVSWRKINIKDFKLGVEGSSKIKGGTGMRSIYSHNDTLICPLELFSTF